MVLGLTIDELAKKAQVRLAVRGRAGSKEITDVYASDRMSDLLGHVTDSTLLVTNLLNPSILRLVELMDVPGICLLKNVAPEPALVETAKAHHTAILVSAEPMPETCGRLSRVLEGEA
jgi:serine kinase of HPr protein (carbohydrate metabolism regulator)